MKTDHLNDILAPVLDGLGLDVETIELRGGPPHRRLQVVVDSDDPVTIDRIAEATWAVSTALDASDPLGDAAYTLEVTSRGADAPLTKPSHWRRNPDRLVRVRLADGSDIEARIVESDDHGVDLRRGGTVTRYPYEDIERAVVEIELNGKDV